jgi:hypothetical protein
MPNETLAAIENALKNADTPVLSKSGYIVRLLRSLAYEAQQFERAIALLIMFAQAVESDDDNSVAGIVPSLFHIVLSGTHAPIAMRLKVLESLLKSDDGKLRSLGLKSLDAVLKTDHFSSAYDFEFGARSRDYGYYPATGKDVQDWFGAALHVAAPLASSDVPAAAGARGCIARAFRGLWSHAGQLDALESLVREIAKKGFWRDGWAAVRQARIYDGKHMPPDIRDRLTSLEELLRPKNLVDQVNGIVLETGGNMDLDDLEEVENDGYAGAADRMNRTIRNLGNDVSKDDNAFKTLLPGLVKGGSRVHLFGEAVGDSTEKPYEIWQAFVTTFGQAEKPATGVIGGFLAGLQKRDAGLTDKMLDEALEQASPLAPYFPQLQASVSIDARGVERLHRALDLGHADITQFLTLAWGRASDNIPGPAFRDLLLAIADKPGGLTVSLEILSMRLFSDAADERKSVPEAAEAGRVLLDAFEFHKKDQRTDREDRELGRIAQVSLAGDEGVVIVRRIVRKMMLALRGYEISAHDQDDLMTALLRVHPEVVLDEAFSGDTKAVRNAVQAFVGFQRFNKNPLEVVPDDILVAWCERDPSVRYPVMAASAGLFKRSGKDQPHEWLPLASKLLAKAPDPDAVLKEIVTRLHPTSWSGSLATKLEGRLRLLEKLPIGDASGLSDALNRARSVFQQRIARERENEAAESRARDGRFED